MSSIIYLILYMWVNRFDRRRNSNVIEVKSYEEDENEKLLDNDDL